MIDTKLSTLQHKLSSTQKREKYLKERVSVWRKRALEDRKMIRDVVLQYERLVRECRSNVKEFKSNIVKLFIIHLYTKFKNWKGG